MPPEEFLKLDRIYNLRISEYEEKLIDRFNRIQRRFLAEALRKQLRRILIRCPICGEMVGKCIPECPSRE